MGKARTFSNEGEEANYLKESEDEIYNSTQQNSYNLGSTTFSDQSGIGNFAQSGTDQRKADLTGALFRGNIGFLLQSAVLDDTTNTINLLFDQSNVAVSDVSSDRIVIISGFAVSSDLEIILGAQRPGQRLVLYNTDGNTITIKDASTAASPTDANLIRTPGGLDYIITGFDSTQLVFDSIEEQWRIVGAVGTGGGTGYNLIKDPAGVALTQRTTMKFLGNIVSIVDNVGTMETEITISSPSGTIPDGTAENQHLEWDNSGLAWTVVDFLTMGAFGPFASTGLIRTANDQFVISSRNVGDSGDIAVKVNSSDKFIFQFPGAVVPLEISFNEIDVKTVDIVNIDRAKFVVSSGSMVPNSDTGILLNSNNQFQFNTSDTRDFTFTFDNNDPSFVIDRLTASNDSTLVSVLSDETDINSQSFLNITKSFSIPLSLQEIGSLNFIAGNSAGSTLFEYASIIGKIEDTTNGSIDGSMIFNATVNDSVTAFIQLNNSSDGIIKALKDVTLENSSLNPVLTFFRNQTGVTDNPLGNIVFKGLQSNNNPFIYSTISSTISDATLGQEDSIITLSTTSDGLVGNVQLVVNADSSQILRFDSTSLNAAFASPVLELLAAVSIAPPTGAVQRIGEMNFEATTNNGGGIGAVETFAQIIVDQEESDITNESGSMRFRLRDQTATTGALKTYLRFNDASNGRIDALKDLAMTGNDVIGIQALGFNEIGGQIAVADDSAGFNFVTTSDRPFRFTPNATNVLDIDDTGLTMLSGNIELGNGNVTGVNQIAFNVADQTITDNINGLRFSLPDFGDTYDFEINGTVHFSLENFFANWFDTYQQYSETVDPASPPAGDVFFYAKLSDGIAKLFYKQSDGIVIGPLGIGGNGNGGGGNLTIVKTEDESKGGTTLTDDSELLFTPTANKSYFIEVDVKFISQFVQIKFAINGGADMTYQIVEENTATLPNDWSAIGGPNDEFVNFSNTNGTAPDDEHHAIFYAFVQVNGNVDDITVSWAQFSANPNDAILKKGSAMRIFEEGINGGGGGGDVNEVLLSTTNFNDNFARKDVDHFLLGNDNGFSNLNIAMGNSEPGPFTFSYTITAQDFPVGIDGINWTRYGVSASFQCRRISGSGDSFMKFFVGGTEIGDDDFTFNPGFSFLNGSGGSTSSNITIGTVISFKVWTSSGSYEFDQFACWVYPVEGAVTAATLSLDFTGLGGDLNLGGDDPAGGGIDIESLTYRLEYNINESDTIWGRIDEDLTIVKGNKLTPRQQAPNFIQTTNQDNVTAPGIGGLIQYQFVD